MHTWLATENYDWIIQPFPGINLWHIVIPVVALALSVILGSPVVNLILKWAEVEPALETNYSGTDKATVLSAEKPAREILRGGLWIGRLERFAVTLTILVGQPGLLAVVVGVKGLGRYPELKDNPHSAEKFLIGTAASLIWATLLGLAGLKLMSLV
ncbi:MAG: hypothetical protein Q4D73_01460 [Actinomycetaceae bacterium]|nr:hypothetical protein [Actinomycetaceae bacterium]